MAENKCSDEHWEITWEGRDDIAEDSQCPLCEMRDDFILRIQGEMEDTETEAKEVDALRYEVGVLHMQLNHYCDLLEQKEELVKEGNEKVTI